MDQLGMDALIVIGGDGTQTLARDLSRLGIPVVGVPKTIDNDLSATEVTFGFDTALHVATDAIDRLHTTAESHGRVMVIEVMGRDAGLDRAAFRNRGRGRRHPDSGNTIHHRNDLRETPRTSRDRKKVFHRGRGRRREAPPTDPFGKPFPKPRPGQVGIMIGDAIHESLKQDVRTTVLGHIQRGGSPSPFRPHPVHAIRSGSRGIGGARGIRAHGMPARRGDRIGSARRSRGRGAPGGPQREYGARRASRRNYVRG